jgi:hypothetical protein
MNLIQPERIARQGKRRAQPQPILKHRTRVIANVRAEIQARIRPDTDAARASRCNGAHVLRRWPIGLDELQSGHLRL